MTTITKERIELFIKNPLDNGLTRGEQMELARIALASLEAEPVAVNDDMAYAFHHALSDSSLGADEVEEIKAGLRAAFANVTIQPEPVVPDEIEPDDSNTFDYVDGWNACHAAMLQGSQPVSQSKTYRLDFGQWLEQQRGKIDVDCGCVSTETFMHWLRVAYEAGNYPDIPDSSVPAPGKGVTGERIRIKPHVYRELVNRLHDTAIKCAGTQQLRERISRVLGDVITPYHHKQAEKSGLERCHLEAALNIKPGHTLGIIDALLVHKMARALLSLVDAGDTSEGEV